MSGWWFGTFFIFPNSWDDDPIWLYNIFQRDWNHQLDVHPDYILHYPPIHHMTITQHFPTISQPCAHGSHGSRSLKCARTCNETWMALGHASGAGFDRTARPEMAGDGGTDIEEWEMPMDAYGWLYIIIYNYMIFYYMIIWYMIIWLDVWSWLIMIDHDWSWSIQ